MSAPLKLGYRGAAGGAGCIQRPPPHWRAAAFCVNNRVELRRRRGPPRWLLERAAAEEAGGLSTADSSDDVKEEEQDVAVNGSGSAEPAAETSMQPGAAALQKVKDAIDQGTVDDAFLESLLPELESEFSGLEESRSTAEAEAASLKSEVDASKDSFLRLTADFENFKKRSATEQKQLRDNVKGDVISQLLPLIDNFELAKSQVKCETEQEIKINNSYQGLYKQMVEIFRGLGVEAVDAVGEPFDPNLHEAVLSEPSSDVPDQTVLEEFRKGFMLSDRLLRPAMVKVSSGEAAPELAVEEDSMASESVSESKSESESSEDSEEASTE